ncbi:MAG TPA: glycosyltransferase family 4 protein [Phycisphaerales bacterium]|nr:glycosyltransferase family 4 protein [Phycisphaerales bacterium]HMP37438.1 glycosyltransferase family 4 protein [Phycisphaerales bacterium]
MSGATLRVLYVSDSLPFPTDVGGPQRTNLLVRALGRCAAVDALLLVDWPTLAPGVREAVTACFNRIETVTPTPRGQFGPWRAIRPLHPRLVDRLAHNLGSRLVDLSPDPRVVAARHRLEGGRPYDLCVGRYLRPAARAGLTEVGPSILDIDDLETSVYESRLESARGAAERWLLRRHIRALRELLPLLHARFAHLWIAAENDRAAVAAHPSVSVLPNIPFQAHDDPIEPLPPPGPSEAILVVASWHYGPNRRGLDRFLSRVWPRVRSQCPAATLRVVGSRMSETDRARWAAAPGVEVVGRVEDLRDAYAACAFAVAPVYEGGGTKIKVLETLALGRACVVTDHAWRGYEGVLLDREGIMVGRDDEGLASACIELLRDRPLRDRLARRGGELVRARFSWQAICDEVRRAALRTIAGTDER